MKATEDVIRGALGQRYGYGERERITGDVLRALVDHGFEIVPGAPPEPGPPQVPQAVKDLAIALCLVGYEKDWAAYGRPPHMMGAVLDLEIDIHWRDYLPAAEEAIKVVRRNFDYFQATSSVAA